MRYKNNVGPQVRRRRYALGWSQSDFAAKLQIAGFDISRSGVSKIEAFSDDAGQNRKAQPMTRIDAARMLKRRLANAGLLVTTHPTPSFNNTGSFDDCSLNPVNKV
jgi:transcriptional regulator with XRE-family HTH domain